MTKITYQDLFAIYREEKSSNALSGLPEDFDSSLEEMINVLCEKSKTDPQALKELENARKVAISIIQLRRQKIIMRAINAQEAKLLGANQRENEFYEKMLALCAQQDGWLSKIISPTRMREPEAKVEKKKIRLLKEVPQYTAADGKTYGPYKEGEEVEILENEAKWMVEGKLAEWTEQAKDAGI